MDNIYFHNNFTVIIGISDYQDDIKNLPYAANDAIRFYKALKKCGYSDKRIHLLTSRPVDNSVIYDIPTRNNIIKVFTKIASESHADDLVLVYIACYGVDIFERPYLLAQDTQLDYLISTSVDLSELIKLLKQSRARVKLQLFDICRSHFAPGRQLISRMTAGFLNMLMQSEPGWATFCSCSQNEYANESPEYKQGIFSYYLNNALEQGVGLNDKMLTLDQAIDYVQNNVVDWAYKRRLKQNPVFSSNLSGSLVLSINSGREQEPDLLPYKYRFFDNSAIPSQPDIQESEAEPEPAPAPVSVPHPAQEITSFYDKRSFIRKAPASIINHSFENTCQRFFKSIDSYIRDFSHPYITIYRTEPVELKILSYFINQEFIKFLDERNSGETVQESIAIQIFFKNAEQNAPVSSLYINFVNFTNYYWLWYCLPFETIRMYGEFLPTNPMKINYMPLRPPNMLSAEMITRIVSDVFRDCTETIIDWTRQLNSYLIESKK